MQTEKLSQRFDRLWWLRAVIALLIVPILLVLGYAGFSLQGYTNDLGSRPVQSWQFGTACLILAGVLTWIALRPRPMGKVQFILIGLAVAVLVFSLWRPF